MTPIARSSSTSSFSGVVVAIGMRLRLQIYTVPGVCHFRATKKLILRGVDGIVFVADSRPKAMEDNVRHVAELDDNLRGQGRSLADVPHVVQLNKRDVADAVPVSEMAAALNPHDAPVVEATASHCEHVVETLRFVKDLVVAGIGRMAE